MRRLGCCSSPLFDFSEHFFCAHNVFLERGLVAHLATLTIAAVITKATVVCGISVAHAFRLLPLLTRWWAGRSVGSYHLQEALVWSEGVDSRMWLASECAFHCADYVQNIGSVLACRIRQVITGLEGV